METVFVANAGQSRNQALRTALALCALSGTPARFAGIVDESPRPAPGLGPAHLAVAAAAAKVSGGSFQGSLGSADLRFNPRSPLAGDYSFDLAQHGRVLAPLGWLMEAVALPLAGAAGPSSALLAGGTHVLPGPISDYLSLVLTPNLRSLGLEARFSEIAPGFAPSGAGEAELSVSPFKQLTPLQAEGPFRPEQVGVQAVTCGLPIHLAEQALEGALGRLELHGIKAQTTLRRANGPSKGLALLIWAQAGSLRVGFSAVGKRGGRPEALATEAAEALVSLMASGAGLPCELATLLLPYLACASGHSRLKVDVAASSLRAAVKAVESVWPGTARLLENPQGGPAELRVLGRGLGQAS